MKAICNIDTLESGIDLENWDEDSEFVKLLEGKKAEIQNLGIDFIPIKINDVVFNLQSFGIRFYQYVLINEDCFNIYVSKKAMTNNCPIRVTLRSTFLWENGYWKAWEKVKQTIESMGFTYFSSKLSRVDLACHVQGLNLTDIFQTTADFIKIRTRAKHRCRPEYDFGKYPEVEMTSMVVGSGENIMLRIYDKNKELTDKRALAKEALFKDVWQNAGIKEIDGHVFNVEFQIRREAFKTFHFSNGEELSSVENLFFCINDIWDYLTNEWFSLVDPESDSNRTRQRLLESWEFISKQKFDLEEMGFTELQRMYHKSIKQEVALRGVAAYATSYAVLNYEKDCASVMSDISSRLGFMIDVGMYDWGRKIREKLNKLSSIQDVQIFHAMVS